MEGWCNKKPAGEGGQGFLNVLCQPPRGIMLAHLNLVH